MPKKYEHGLFIFRRDLRIQDNKGLKLMNDECEKTFAIFIFTPEQIGKNNKYKSNNCVQFMIESLQDLEKNINKIGGKIYFFYGNNNSIIQYLIDELNIDVVGFNLDCTPYAVNRDFEIMNLCDSMGVDVLFENDYYLNEIGTILNGSGDGYLKFTPYYNQASKKRIENVDKSAIHIQRLNKQLDHTIHLDDAMRKFTKINNNLIVTGGRIEGIKMLKDAVKTQKHYSRTKNNIFYNTSLLSAYIKFGCLSIREIYKAFHSNSNFIRQLHWRDFYAQIIYFYPHVINNSLKPNYDKIKWHNNKRLFHAWCSGNTGFPIVDASMRQLNNCGWMHNRGRMITSSFLTKILLIDWRHGEQYFATKLVDYDPANNNGGWQWSAGTGADSQPYFRIFNPFLQSETHDPDCIYIKRWIPELTDVPNNAIHKWDLEFNNHDVNYPSPIVNYSEQKEKALKMYKSI